MEVSTMATEMSKAKELVSEILNRGYVISVFDGEEYTVKRSKELSAITKALNTADGDTLVVRNADNNKIGWFELIWGNASNGEELVADYSANDTCEEIWNKIFGSM